MLDIDIYEEEKKLRSRHLLTILWYIMLYEQMIILQEKNIDKFHLFWQMQTNKS